MGQRVISSSYPVARKIYGCGACDWITEGLDYFVDELTFAEKRIVVKARQNGWRIMKGEKHLRSTFIGCDEEIYTWRAIIDIHKLCMKYEIYQDVC